MTSLERRRTPQRLRGPAGTLNRSRSPSPFGENDERLHRDVGELGVRRPAGPTSQPHPGSFLFGQVYLAPALALTFLSRECPLHRALSRAATGAPSIAPLLTRAAVSWLRPTLSSSPGSKTLLAIMAQVRYLRIRRLAKLGQPTAIMLQRRNIMNNADKSITNQARVRSNDHANEITPSRCRYSISDAQPPWGGKAQEPTFGQPQHRMRLLKARRKNGRDCRTCRFSVSKEWASPSVEADAPHFTAHPTVPSSSVRHQDTLNHGQFCFVTHRDRGRGNRLSLARGLSPSTSNLQSNSRQNLPPLPSRFFQYPSCHARATKHAEPRGYIPPSYTEAGRRAGRALRRSSHRTRYLQETRIECWRSTLGEHRKAL